MVARPTHVVVKAQDRDGNTFKFNADGFAARVVCHELDHLDGVLFTDKVIRYVEPEEEEDSEE